MNISSSFERALESDFFTGAASPLSFIVGENEHKQIIISDLSQLPHIVIAGATGTGKSTFAHGMILSLVRKATPKNLGLILCDTKILEFSQYDSLPHLLFPPVTDSGKIADILRWADCELNRRIKLFSSKRCRDISSYNDLAWESFEEELPRIVLFVDDASVVVRDSASQIIIHRIAQSGRSAGMHLVLITQSVSSKGLSEIVKNSIPVRAVFNVLSPGEERLLLGGSNEISCPEVGMMVYCDVPARSREIVHCFAISDYAISTAIADSRARFPSEDKRLNNLFPTEQELLEEELFSPAVDVILETGQASVSMLQRRFKLGYARAARIIDEMEEKGIVSPFQGSKPRQILITKEQWKAMKDGRSAEDLQCDCCDTMTGDCDLMAGDIEEIHDSKGGAKDINLVSLPESNNIGVVIEDDVCGATSSESNECYEHDTYDQVESVRTDAYKRTVRYVKRIFYPFRSWVIAFFAVKAACSILNLLNPSQFLIWLMPILQFMLPIVAAFRSLCKQIRKEAEEDGELQEILSKPIFPRK